MKTFYLLMALATSPTFMYGQRIDVDSMKLHDVIASFQASIADKDSITFNQLFFTGKVPFVGIMSKATEWSIKKDYDEFEGIAVSNHRKFISDICKSKTNQKEVFYNTVLSHDHSIASISFDYAYYSSNKMIQWGHEKWNLVKISNQWMITDVIYSIHFPDVEPFPFE